MSTHEHADWMLDDSASGGTYCRACGASVNAPTAASLAARYDSLSTEIAERQLRGRDLGNLPDERYAVLVSLRNRFRAIAGADPHGPAFEAWHRSLLVTA